MLKFVRSSALVLVGVGAGFVVAHLVNSTPQGREFLSRVSARADSFTEAVRDGYRAQTEALLGAIDTRR